MCVKRIPIGGGTPTTICPTALAPSGIAWTSDGILFALAGTGILRVSASGGEPEVVVPVKPSEGLAHGPQQLPGGFLLFTLVSASQRGADFPWDSDREGDGAVYWQPADGGTAERLTKPEPGTVHVPESWSPAGDVFLFSIVKQSDVSLWIFDTRDRKAAPFSDIRSSNFATAAVFSPDGRWVAYQFGEPGQAEGTTYVQPFPPNGKKYQIARGGRPAWSRDGSELFYVPAPGQFAGVKVTTQPTFEISNPMPVHRGFGVADPGSPRPYDVTPDGRFVGIGIGAQAGGSTGPAQLHVVINWFEELKARVPTRR